MPNFNLKSANRLLDHKETKEELTAWKLSDFDVLDTIGTGTFGRVRLCRNKTSGKFYALKILKKAEIVRLKQVEHTISEKDILSTIDSHPFLVQLYKTFQDELYLYMIFEYVIGGEIFSHLRKAGKFPNDVAKFYIAEIVLAIEYLHTLDIVYRDLKPENLLLDKSGHIKITDFGFAKRVADRTWTLCGTPEYLAPEIILSKGHGKDVDWWALGILCYEMLVGYPPFFDESPFRIYEKILEGRIDFPRFMDPLAKDLICKLLTHDKSQRLGSRKTSGAEDVRKHPWFTGVDWLALYNKSIMAPIPVKQRFEGDTQNYDKYDDRGPLDYYPYTNNPNHATNCAQQKLPPDLEDLFKSF